MRRFIAMVLMMFPAAGLVAHAEQRAPVDLELAFVVDASGSIDDEETRLQRQGYAEGLANARVLNAITGGFLRAIAVAYIEFAADGCERLSVPWTRIDGMESARAFGGRVLAQPVMFCPGGDAIGDAVAFAIRSLETNGFDLWIGHGDDVANESWSFPFFGLLDELSLWDRALTASEVRVL